MYLIDVRDRLRVKFCNERRPNYLRLVIDVWTNDQQKIQILNRRTEGQTDMLTFNPKVLLAVCKTTGKCQNIVLSHFLCQ